MIDRLLSFIAPHHCCGCDKIGSLLCEYCKYDITDESFMRCLHCGRRPAGSNGLCGSCRVPYSRAWCVGWRQDNLKQLIDVYKFSRARAADRPLAGLLDEIIPTLPPETVLVPIPTISSHVRMRGYDHIDRIIKRFGTMRRLSIDRCLARTMQQSQRGSSRKDRLKRAREAFVCTKSLDPDVPYLIVDDVLTTGATVKYAAQALKEAGARTIWVAVISRQPLDET